MHEGGGWINVHGRFMIRGGHFEVTIVLGVLVRVCVILGVVRDG